MKQYLDLLKDVLENGEWKEPARPGMPRTKEVFGRMMKFNLREGFPLMTTKKMHYKGIIAELLWFLSGSTNVYDLNKMGCKIWNDDAYRFHKSTYKENAYEREEWDKYLELKHISPGDKRMLFECGYIYGSQWNEFGASIEEYGEGFNQIQYLIDNIKNNPNSRYHVVSAWNPVDFVSEYKFAALPACHMLFQCSVRNGMYIDLSIIMRSNDLFLGAPYNIASYALLANLIASVTGYMPGELTYYVNSAHIYENHIDQIKEQLGREPLELPGLYFEYKDSIFEYSVDDFKIENYKSHPSIKAPLSVGI